MEKRAQIHMISKQKKFKLSNFYDEFQQVAKNVERFWFFFIFISNMYPNLAKSPYGWLPL